MSSGAIKIGGLVKRYGAFTAVDNVSLEVAPGSLVSLLGPSGCGKTTTLRMIAGFIEPDEGTIAVDGDVLSRPGGTVAPERRHMGMVFQSYAVWPHMTVFDNIAYGLRSSRTAGQETKRRVAAIVELVGLAGQEKKFPSALSGGQQQRVALARAVVTEPRILLLDEPLSNLDTKLRETMRYELRRIQQSLGITTIFVTHSQEEALVMSDQIAVMRGGSIVEQGTSHQLYSAPRTRFVADFIGLANLIQGEITGSNNGRVRLATPQGPVEANAGASAGANIVLVRPQHIELCPPHERGGVNDFAARVTEASFNGSFVDYVVDWGGGSPLRAQTFTPQKFQAGDQVRVRFSPDSAITVAGD